MGRLSADFASCSLDIAWYMSKPTNEMNLYVRYGANAAMNISTMPEIGSLIEARSRSMGALTCPMATRNTTTMTSFEKMSATTNAAHLPNHPFAASQVNPARAMGAKTMATSSSALRMSSVNQTMPAPAMPSPARKIVMIAPTPGEEMLIVVSPAASSAMRSPMLSIVFPVACTMPMAS